MFWLNFGLPLNTDCRRRNNNPVLFSFRRFALSTYFLFCSYCTPDPCLTSCPTFGAGLQYILMNLVEQTFYNLLLNNSDLRGFWISLNISWADCFSAIQLATKIKNRLLSRFFCFCPRIINIGVSAKTFQKNPQLRHQFHQLAIAVNHIVFDLIRRHLGEKLPRAIDFTGLDLP